jgi:hypothetical protein
MRANAYLLTIVVSGVSACGAGSDWFPSDVEENATLAAAGDAAATKVCSAFEDYLLDQYRGSLLVRVACTAMGVQNTETSAACGDYVDDCINNPPSEVTSTVSTIVASAGCGAVADYESSGCSKTISDLRACLDAVEREVTELEYTITCALAGQPLPAGSLTIDQPAECASIENACPLPG